MTQFNEGAVHYYRHIYCLPAYNAWIKIIEKTCSSNNNNNKELPPRKDKKL